jgi:hypothetical protein
MKYSMPILCVFATFMAHPQVADGGDGLQIRTVVTIILNVQFGIEDKVRWLSVRVGRKKSNP